MCRRLPLTLYGFFAYCLGGKSQFLTWRRCVMITVRIVVCEDIEVCAILSGKCQDLRAEPASCFAPRFPQALVQGVLRGSVSVK